MNKPIFKQKAIFSEYIVTPEIANEELTSGPSPKQILTKNTIQKIPRAIALSKPSDKFGEISSGEPEKEYYSKKRAGVLEIDPKVMEPYEPIPNKAPRKVVIDRMKKLFSSLSIEELLDNEKVNYKNTAITQENWLPLEPYDDILYECRNPEEWIECGFKNGIQHYITGKGLYRNRETGLNEWKNVLIDKYDKERGLFLGEWEGTRERARLSRLSLMFDAEDPRVFAKRFQAACDMKEFSDSMIKYEFILDNMPTQDLSTLDSEQVLRVLAMSHGKKMAPAKQSQSDVQLLSEINLDFARTMNKIIFDKYISENEDNTAILATKLILPPKKEIMEARYMGQVEIPTYNFADMFSAYCFNTLHIKEEVIKALDEIRDECLKVRTKEIFCTKFDKIMRIEEFKQIEESSISQCSYYMKETWVNRIKDIILKNFQTVGKGWFSINVKEESKETYEFGKTKKFLTVLRLVMEEYLLELSDCSLKQYVKILCDHYPITSEVVDAGKVANNYNMDPFTNPKTGEISQVEPLFLIDIILKPGQDTPKYSTDLTNFQKTIMAVFDKGVDDFHEIHQMEPKILVDLFKTQHKMFLKTPVRPKSKPDPKPNPDTKTVDENTWVWNLYEFLEEKTKEALEPLNIYIKKYEKYKEVSVLNPEEYVRSMDSETNAKPTEEIKKDILDNMSKEKAIYDEIPEQITVSAFRINCKDVRSLLSGKYSQIVKLEQDLLAKRWRKMADDIIIAFQNIQLKLSKPPKDIEELIETKNYLRDTQAEITKQDTNIQALMQIADIIDEFSYKMTTEDMDNKWKIFGSPKSTIALIEKHTTFLEKEKERFLEQMAENQSSFKEKIEDLQNIVDTFSNYQDLNAYSECAEIVRSIADRLKKSQEEARIFNQRESLFGRDITDYSQVNRIIKEFTPYQNLWLTAEKFYSRYKNWLNGKWEELKGKEVEETVENGLKTIQMVGRYFKEKASTIQNGPKILEISDSIKKSLDEFRPYVPLAVALSTEGMKDRHWDEISKKVGFEIKPTMKSEEPFTFKKVMDMGMLKYIDVCNIVGEKAGREYSIECNLKKMQDAWVDIAFKLKEYKASKTFVVATFEQAQIILDDHLTITQGMQFSLFKEPFKEEIESWNNKLKRVSDVIEEWIKCQKNWSYLQPIFSSEDIAKQLAGEYNRFKAVDTLWRSTMNQLSDNPKTLDFCSKEGLLEKLQSANGTLEQIQKALNDYLESKRKIFARFYFLSNDELLQILSQTKEVENVRPHLRKVFENMADMVFTDQKNMVTMISSEEEKVNFVKPIDPKGREVEFWMGDVEKMMQVTVRAELLKAIMSYRKVNRCDWTRNHPSQCILTGSQIHWTHEVEDSIKKYGPKGPEIYFQKLSDQLMQTVKMVREKLNPQLTVTLNALIVLDVHGKDVIEKLSNLHIGDIGAFEWIMQLRVYWENSDCFIKCTQTVFPYGYEYLGVQNRLVITPLTDKCFMTLMGALKLNLGGAPAGPAGTGKTESVKDLAKGIGKQCVVFNCSDDTDYILVGKFFKGLASSGAWICFDEFNRINLEVLSVIAQQLQVLFKAKEEGVASVSFEGSEIKMLPTFSIFITMNPGYAGRTELPDNLKALFRPMAMMVPDYALIGTIRLYSFGFQTAKDLARKMVVTFKLSSEQLSSQDHYDYGMRAVNTVINAAGLLKTKYPDVNEDQLLLRALRDVNVPKFLKIDLPLFENIILDIFPGVEKPKFDINKLLQSIKDSMKFYNLQPKEEYIDKIIQLYDTTNVRHGLMIVGPTGGGKTCNYKILSKAITDLKKNSVPGFDIIKPWVLNPKSITQQQLFGYNDSSSEWIDGIMAILVETCSADTSPDRHWIIADGPVDTLWIESMNSVLDDSKKLCLNSGKIIRLSNRITMMFEVEDLLVASPATVSRCGMVYMEPSVIGLDPLFSSWVNSQPEYFKACKNFVKNLETMYKKTTEDMFNYLRSNLLEPVPTVDNNVIQSLFRILDSFFLGYKNTEIKTTTAEEVEELSTLIQDLWIFALVWSVGCTTNLEGRMKFNIKMRDLLKDMAIEFPPDNLVYDFLYQPKEKKWINWMETTPTYEVKASIENYQEILVPTTDSIRTNYLNKLLICNSLHILNPGPTGTGKSASINELLSNGLGENFQSTVITFSAQTSANQTQDILFDKIEKRRIKVFGPPAGKKLVIFVDDLNMPKKEKFGAQPPIELIRQWMDHKSIYEYQTKEKNLIKIEDIIFVAAMGPPGGGRNPITNRLQRHFNIITLTTQQEETIRHIYSTIIKAFLNTQKYQASVRDCLDKIISMTLRTYKEILTYLLPTPTKSHYTFNLRDISKLMMGVCSAYTKTTNSDLDLIRLWVHESKRVFGDRLINNEDREWLDNLYSLEIKSTCGYEKAQVFNVERIIFVDFLNGIDSEIRNYTPVTDLKELSKLMDRYLEEYNSMAVGSKRPMKLVMFMDACEHVSRICRVIRQPQGNALLLGVGGSGRQSLAKLATYLANYLLFQIEITKSYGISSWRDDLKRLLKSAGLDDKQSTFLFCDTQIFKEQTIEDINNIINSGDTPNLYKKDDMEEIDKMGTNECIKKRIQPTKMNKFLQYLSRVRKNIHIVLAFSPLSNDFRSYIRNFPSLVNCMTIDWFTEWPQEALIGVARGELMEKELNLGDTFDGVVEMFKDMHQDVEKKAIVMNDVLRRKSYVTPTSFLELIKIYKEILEKKRLENFQQKNRLEKGLEVLMMAARKVDELKKELNKKQPELEETRKEIIKTKENIEIEKEDANKMRIEASKGEEIAVIKEAEVSKLKAEADAELSQALPLLDAALKEVAKINVKDLIEIRTYKTAMTMTIVYIFEMVCIMFDKKPKKPNDAKIAASDPQGYFECAKQQLLNNPQEFLENLKTYDKNNIKEARVKKVMPILGREDFNEQSVAKASKALVPLYLWCDAMMKYHVTLKKVTPLMEKAAELDKELKKVRDELEESRRKLREIDERIALLQKIFKEKSDEEARLMQQIEDCNIKLERATKLITGLQSEKQRWGKEIENLNEKYSFLIGDCLVSSGMVAYSGVFTAQYRSELENEWVRKLDKLRIRHSENLTMKGTLGNDVVIRNWLVQQLPSDNLSIENAIITFTSKRWPLMIDPQSQANQFIRNLGRDHEQSFESFKQSETSIIKQLETAIEQGKWVLLENIGEKLDASLEAILLMQKLDPGVSKNVRLGEKVIKQDHNFAFFMTTTLMNPHYSPEIAVRVTLLNFAITQSGLEEQLLNQLVSQEQPDLQEKKKNIVIQNARSAKELRDIEDTILKELTRNTDIMAIIADEKLINMLADSKKKADDINQRIEESKKTEAEIDNTRKQYKPVAYRASILFFCIIDLAMIDSMYQYSLKWFTGLFISAIDNAPQCPNDIKVRRKNIRDFFTLSLYENICRSLFEKHKLLFSFLLTTKIQFGKDKINSMEWRYLLAGPSGDITIMKNPWPWMPDKEWGETYKQFWGLKKLDAFKNIEDTIVKFEADYKRIFDSNDPTEEALPGEFETKLDQFQRLFILKAVRSDKFCAGAQKYVTKTLSQKFIEPPTFDLSKCYKDSSNTLPLIFILSQGSDPIGDFNKFAEDLQMSKKVHGVSLGQGQEEKALKLIEDAKQIGGWVLLQNCHLSRSFMPRLESVVEQLNDSIHRDFRMWLTSMPSEVFPVYILQNSVKMTIEPPAGLKANLLRTYANMKKEELKIVDEQSKIYQKLLFGFCFFHAVVQDRRKFGPIGWNIQYEFNNEDLKVSKRQLKIFLDEYPEVPYKVLLYLVGEINYGGRVTDDKDGRLIRAITARYITPKLFEEDYKFSKSGLYYAPPPGDLDDYLKYIKMLPLETKPEVFGLHDNAAIITAQNETRDLLNSILNIQPRASSSGGKSRDQIIFELSQYMETKTPKVYDEAGILKKYPTQYNESMNTVLIQEILRYNGLIKIMKSSLESLKKALKGLELMNEELELMSNSFYNNQVPVKWSEKGFLSLKPLGSWITDLTDRITFFNNWINNGTPKVFWFSGFFFPQAFLTGVSQNFARKHVVAIDRLSFKYSILDHITYKDIKEKPDDGCYVYGLFLEGARWNPEKHLIDESYPKELYTDIPLMQLIPTVDKVTAVKGLYNCPIYKVLSRQGTLSTTGHSTNFVFFIEFPIDTEEEIWTLAGVAGFLALRY